MNEDVLNCFTINLKLCHPSPSLLSLSQTYSLAQHVVGVVVAIVAAIGIALVDVIPVAIVVVAVVFLVGVGALVSL